MHISHLLIQNVRGIEALDLTLTDEWRGTNPDTVLLVGPNGSGKTTVLNIIASIWHLLGEFVQIESKPANTRFQTTGLLTVNEGSAAMRVSDWAGRTMYVCAGQQGVIEHTLVDLAGRDNVEFVVGFGFATLTHAERIGDFWFADKTHAPVSIHTPDRIPDYVSQWVRDTNEKLLRNTLGKSNDLPNIVYFPSERRYLNVGSYEPKPEADAFEWLYTYDAGTTPNGGLQNYLFNLKVVDGPAFDRAIAQINGFWNGKHVDGFDPRTRQLMVKTATGARHPINDLSSGEKQVLLMLSHIAQRLRPGGILLIDEPDLHLHPALSTAFVSHLRRTVSAQDGQLILASHSPDLRQLFASNELIYLGERDEVSA